LKRIILAAVLVVVIIIGIIIGLSICKPEKKKETAPPKVEIFPSPTWGISPVFFKVKVKVSSDQVELKNVVLFFDDEKILEFKVNEDLSITESDFSINITGGKKFVELTTQYVVQLTEAVGKISYFRAFAENIEGKSGEQKKEVIILENKPCTVQITIVSPFRGDVIDLPPLTVQLGALVLDDRCGSFSPQEGTKCDFKFIWDADNQGDNFQPDGQTNQPLFQFTYTKPGFYTPRVKVIDDGGNECESANLIPIIVARKIENITPISSPTVHLPRVFVSDFGDRVKLFSSRIDFGVQEYSLLNRSFIFDSSFKVGEIAYGVDVGQVQDGKILLYKLPEQIFGFRISDSYVNWSHKVFELNRSYDEATFLHYDDFLTAIILFSGNSFKYIIPYPTWDFSFSTELKYNFFPPYSVFRDGNFLFFAHRIELQNKIVVYKLQINYDNFYKSFIIQGYEKSYEFDLDYAPTRISFFKEGGRIYIVVSTGEQDTLFASRTYIFDITSCDSGTCQVVNKTNITMDQVILNIPHSEICPLSDPYRYNINILDFFIPQNFSLCGDSGICLLSLICLDRVGGKKCEKSGIYPFMFSDGEVRKLGDCITFDPQNKIIYSRGSTSIFHSGRFISAYDFSGGKPVPLDYESLIVEPESLSGFQAGITIYLSFGGIGGIEVLKFDRNGNFQNLDLHLYIKPEGKFADINYSVKKHYLDENIIAAVLERSGCGEEWIFSGILIYDFRDKDSIRRRKPKIYKPYSELDVHSITAFYVKKLDSGKYKIVLGGTKCQDPQFKFFEFELDLSSFELKEISRLVFGSSFISFEILPSGNVVISSPASLYLIRDGKVEREIQGEGGGYLKLYQNILFEVLSEGNYIKIKAFDLNLTKIKDFSWYAGVYPSVSDVDVQSVIDEFFGTGSLDFIFVGLSIPQIYSKISALLVFDATGFVRTSGKGNINIFAVTPAVFDIGAKGMKYFRGAKNMVFLLDFSSRIFRAFLR
jgi:hypothetical protein